MHRDLDELLSELITLADHLDHFRMDGLPPDYSLLDRFSGQKCLHSSIVCIFEDFATHSAGSHIPFEAEHCATIAHYIEFRMKFPNLDSAMLGEIIAPNVSMATKRKLTGTGLTNREVLNLIDTVKEEGKHLFHRGDYRTFIEKFVEDYVPEFAEYC